MPDTDELLRPLVTAWLGKLDIAREVRKKDFDDYAEQCLAFYSGAIGFMYQPEFQAKFFGGQLNPKFKITLNKPFEFVALIGPLLYGQNPDRRVAPHTWPDYPQELIAADMGIDLPSLAEQYQAVQEMQQQAQQTGEPLPPEAEEIIVQYEGVQEHLKQLGVVDRLERLNREALCHVSQTYLNFTPYEQPDGGLKEAAEQGITEAMVTGLGLLQPKVYQVPGSGIRLTGCFYKNNKKLLIDPDAESARFGEATWISLETTEPHFIAERRFGLPYGALKNKGDSSQSADAVGATQGSDKRNEQMQNGTTYDNVTYYDIYSVAGVGTRLSGTPQPLQQSLHKVVGDFARIVVCRGYESPLNAPMAKFKSATTEDVAKMFRWPVEYWRDRKWPVAMLAFYRNIGDKSSPWPISPLRPSLGILVAINVIMSHLVNRTWMSSRTLIAVLKRAEKEVRDALESGEDLQVLGISELNKDLGDVIQYIQQDPVNFDIWRIVEHLFRLLDKSTGMSDIMYAVQQDSTPRSAEDVKQKQQSLSVRPEYMMGKVEDWLSEAARMEMLCAYESKIEPESVLPILGTIGTQLWQNRFLNAQPDEIYREVVCNIASGSARKPNRERDAQNMREIYPPLSQQAGQAWQMGDPGPMNALNKKLGQALQIDLSEVVFQPPQPQDDGAQQQAEMQMQIEQQKAQMEAQKAELDIAQKSAEVELKSAEGQQKIIHDATSAEQNIVQNTERHIQELTQSAEKHRMDMLLLQAEQRIKKSMGGETKKKGATK